MTYGIRDWEWWQAREISRAVDAHLPVTPQSAHVLAGYLLRKSEDLPVDRCFGAVLREVAPEVELALAFAVSATGTVSAEVCAEIERHVRRLVGALHCVPSLAEEVRGTFLRIVDEIGDVADRQRVLAAWALEIIDSEIGSDLYAESAGGYMFLVSLAYAEDDAELAKLIGSPTFD